MGGTSVDDLDRGRFADSCGGSDPVVGLSTLWGEDFPPRSSFSVNVAKLLCLLKNDRRRGGEGLYSRSSS
jgi:hypothetical protein